MNKKYIGKEKDTRENDSELLETYVVKEGDTLYKISRDKNISIEMLSEINGLKSYDYLYPNQKILVPIEGTKLYITKEDDTLNGVANNNDIEISKIIEFNKSIYLLPNQLIIYKE